MYNKHIIILRKDLKYLKKRVSIYGNSTKVFSSFFWAMIIVFVVGILIGCVVSGVFSR